MMTLSLVLLLFQAEEKGFVLERDVELVLIDTLERKREIHRRERVSFQGGNLLIEDLTFGEKVLVRSDLKILWVIDTLAGTWSRIGFDEILERQSKILREISETRKRVAGTSEEKELTRLLQGYGRFEEAPKVEIRVPGKEREIIGHSCHRKDLYLNGNIRRLSVYVDPTISCEKYLETLSQIGAFSKPEAAALKKLGGLPMEGVLRYVSFLDRVQARITAVSVHTLHVSPDVFAPPSTGKQVPLPGFQKAEIRDTEEEDR